jgi:hypothetical protein
MTASRFTTTRYVDEHEYLVAVGEMSAVPTALGLFSSGETTNR